LLFEGISPSVILITLPVSVSANTEYETVRKNSRVINLFIFAL